MAERHTQDPYAPPPRHRDRSGGVVRLLIAAALLGGAAVWGISEFSNTDRPSLVADEAPAQTMAERDANGAYQVTPVPAAPTTPQPQTEAPAEQPPA